jgi:hypothetical protein
VRVQRPLHPHHAFIHPRWWREMLTAEIENLPVVWQLQRRDIRGGVVGRVRSYVPSSGGRNSEF